MTIHTLNYTNSYNCFPRATNYSIQTLPSKIIPPLLIRCSVYTGSWKPTEEKNDFIFSVIIQHTSTGRWNFRVGNYLGRGVLVTTDDPSISSHPITPILFTTSRAPWFNSIRSLVTVPPRITDLVKKIPTREATTHTSLRTESIAPETIRAP